MDAYGHCFYVYVHFVFVTLVFSPNTSYYLFKQPVSDSIWKGLRRWRFRLGAPEVAFLLLCLVVKCSSSLNVCGHTPHRLFDLRLRELETVYMYMQKLPIPHSECAIFIRSCSVYDLLALVVLYCIVLYCYISIVCDSMLFMLLSPAVNLATTNTVRSCSLFLSLQESPPSENTINCLYWEVICIRDNMIAQLAHIAYIWVQSWLTGLFSDLAI